MLRLFKSKKQPDMAIIISEPHPPVLGLENYSDRYLLPFSPRFRTIDFAIASLKSIHIKKIVVFTKKDKENLSNYLINTWPKQNFSIFDQIDLENEFNNFFYDYTAQNNVEFIAIIRGDIPLWFNMKVLKEQFQKGKLIALKYQTALENFIPSLIVEKQLFTQKILNNLIQNSKSLSLSNFTQNFKASFIPMQGLIQPLKSLKEYVLFHLNLIDDYLMLDHFNSYVPVTPNTPVSGIGFIEKNGHLINSIIGENTKIKGKVENSVIFPEVQIEQGCHIKNSVILPGNHIGKNCVITHTLLQESLYENILPNIGDNSTIGSANPLRINEKFPQELNFGYTLIGENVQLPINSQIGGNVFIPSDFKPVSRKQPLIVKDGQALFPH